MEYQVGRSEGMVERNVLNPHRGSRSHAVRDQGGVVVATIGILVRKQHTCIAASTNNSSGSLAIFVHLWPPLDKLHG